MTSAKATLLIDPANPHDFDPGELEQMAVEIQRGVPDLEVVPIRRPEEGAGGPWIEVVHVWHVFNENVGGATAAAAGAKLIIKKLRQRWETDREQHPPPEKPRPRVFNLYESDKLVRSVRIDLPDGDPVEIEVTAGELAPHPRPKLDWRSDVEKDE